MENIIPLSAPFAQGRTAEIYNWDSEHVLKLYYAWCPPHWIENEARVAQAIVAAGIPTPAVGEIIETGGRRGIVYERISGISMLQEMGSHPWTIFRNARILAELQAQIHRLSIPGLDSYHEGLKYTIRRAPHLPDALRSAALALLETLPDEKTLCHGDFHPGNIMLTPRGPVVIDWMTANSGSPWADVARTSMILSIGVKAAGRQVSPVIHLLSRLFHQAYLNHYQALLPSGWSELNRWRPVIAAARLDERIEPEREALLEMVKDGLLEPI